jgi:predicted nucleotidyltransferase
MNEYKIKIRDATKVENLPEESYQFPALQTREELIDFLIRNKAYPYRSKTGKIYFRRLKKAEDENTNFEGIIKNDAVEKLGLQTEEDCRFLREKIKEELSRKREYKPTIKDWPEEERPREMLMKRGAENLSPAKLLAIILQTGDGVKRISAEDLARNLMDCFGNFRNLDSASFSELCSVEGIGMAKAAQIKAALEIGKRFLRLSVLLSPVGQPQINQHVTGATNKHLSSGDIKSIKIPIPPIEIQKEIAAEVQRRRRLAKRLREEANEILEKAKKCVEWIILSGEEKTRKTIRLIADKLKESYNPQKIILYGSYAWGLPDEDSDIDLLIIKDTEEKPHDRIVNAARIISPLRRGYAVDILVITPEELKSRLDIGDQFIEEIISRGEILYG